MAAQVALSFLLLFGAGLFVRSLQNLKTTDTGVALDNLVTFQLSPALSGYDDPRATLLLSATARPPASAPGMKSAGLATRADSRRRRMGQLHVRRRAQAGDGEDMQAFMNALSPGYFETMQIPILEGRDFTRLDVEGGARRSRS